jgi:hypothetical protein
VVPLGSAFQMTFNDVCISPKTPEAVTMSVAMPIIVAQMPEVLLAALATAACSTSAVCCPMRPLNCSMMAFSAASRPNTSPAIAITISNTGAIEVTV